MVEAGVSNSPFCFRHGLQSGAESLRSLGHFGRGKNSRCTCRTSTSWLYFTSTTSRHQEILETHSRCSPSRSRRQFEWLYIGMYLFSSSTTPHTFHLAVSPYLSFLSSLLDTWISTCLNYIYAGSKISFSIARTRCSLRMVANRATSVRACPLPNIL